MRIESGLPDILRTIIENKKQWLAECQRRLPPDSLRDRAMAHPSRSRGFAARIAGTASRGDIAVIAEIKRASPSRGVLCANFDPGAIAASYARYGACCLSVLTEHHHFQGSPAHLSAARRACTLPVLRKDFIIDEYQIYESRLLEADCILLIVAALSDMQLQDFTGLANSLGMDVLPEVHDRTELSRGLMLRTPLLGINNRNLHHFDVTLQTTLDLLPDVYQDRILISESGIHRHDDIALLRRHNVHAFLIGEALMRAEEPGQALATLCFPDVPEDAAGESTLQAMTTGD